MFGSDSSSTPVSSRRAPAASPAMANAQASVCIASCRNIGRPIRRNTPTASRAQSAAVRIRPLAMWIFASCRAKHAWASGEWSASPAWCSSRANASASRSRPTPSSASQRLNKWNHGYHSIGRPRARWASNPRAVRSCASWVRPSLARLRAPVRQAPGRRGRAGGRVVDDPQALEGGACLATPAGPASTRPRERWDASRRRNRVSSSTRPAKGHAVSSIILRRRPRHPLGTRPGSPTAPGPA